MSAGTLSILVTAVSAWPSGLTDNTTAHRSSSSEEFRTAGQWGCQAGDHIHQGHSLGPDMEAGRQALSPPWSAAEPRSYFPGLGASPLWHSPMCPGIGGDTG